MNALIAYIQWLSQGQTPGHPFSGRGLVKLPDLKGNPQHGAVVFMDKCAIYHGTNGAGAPPQHTCALGAERLQQWGWHEQNLEDGRLRPIQHATE
jgi:cytochrome c